MFQFDTYLKLHYTTNCISYFKSNYSYKIFLFIKKKPSMHIFYHRREQYTMI